jgi:hypothetical protein
VPTYARTDSFMRDYASLTPDQKAAFRQAVAHFIEDLPTGRFRKGLRVKGVKGAKNIYEMTRANDGRATFQYGSPEIEGKPHVIWRRIGTHDVFADP